METLTRPILEWHVESVPYDGSNETGDRAALHRGGTRAFAFVLDALGHGSEAAFTADLAERSLAGVDPFAPLESIIESCHQDLRGTRGIALCLAAIDAESGTLTWLSVGNIQGVHVQLDSHGMPQFESLIMRAGVVGDRLPELRASRTVLKPGDMVVLATDGIGYGWYGEYRPNVGATALARALRERHCHGKDDALVLALRYSGRDPGAAT